VLYSFYCRFLPLLSLNLFLSRCSTTWTTPSSLKVFLQRGCFLTFLFSFWWDYIKLKSSVLQMKHQQS
jgi:hypothetical protein